MPENSEGEQAPPPPHKTPDATPHTCPLASHVPAILRGLGRNPVRTLPGGGMLVTSPGVASMLQDIAGDDEDIELKEHLRALVRESGAVLENPEAGRGDIREVACHLLAVVMGMAVRLS